MNLQGIFAPTSALTDQQRSRSLRMMTWQGVTATAIFSVVNSGFLAAYALALGANNFQIGILASIPFIMQPFQIPAILIVERFRLRKLIVLLTWFPAQAVWVFLALIPLFVTVPSGPAIAILMGLMCLRGFLIANMSPAWNSWVRDIVPRETMGRFFSRRLAYSTVASIIFGLGGAFFVDFWNGQATGDSAILGYSFVLIFGSVFFGLSSVGVMFPMTEPHMPPPPEPKQSLARSLSAPLRDENFKRLMKFLLFWGFASNLAVPFFAVYMLTRLGLPLSAVIGFTVLSQLFNVLFLRVWGPMADRFGHKAILSVSASLYLLVILCWAFTTMPERYFLTIPLLVVLHVFLGIAAAGVNLSVETIGLKLAPEGQATPYLVGASLSTSIGAAAGPLVGGRFADFFSVRELGFSISWTDPFRDVELPAFFLTGYDFLFALAFLVGLVTLNFLNALREEGEVSRDVVLDELMAQSREMSRVVSTVPGLGLVASVPFNYLRHVPGMDVAMGVTAYQVASSVRSAITAATHSRTAAANIAEQVARGVADAVGHVGDIGEHGVEIARHAARGAMYTVNEVGIEIGNLAKQSVIGTMNVLGRADVDPSDALYGIGYGTVQGANEVGADLSEAVTNAVEGAKEAAHEIGVSQEEAVLQIAQGALEATKTLTPEAAAQVKEALLGEMLPSSDRLALQTDDNLGDEQV